MANVLGNASILKGLVDVESALASVAEDFVPTIKTVPQHVFLVVVQFVQMRPPQSKYNEVWPEVMQDIMKVVTSGETIQRNGKVKKNIPDQQVLVKQ